MAYRSSLNDHIGGFSFNRHESVRKDIVHQHMLAHYRRLYSAKCGIDTSTPSHFKPRFKPKPRPSLPVAKLSPHPRLTNKDMKFLKSLAGEVRTWWNQDSSRPSLQHCNENNCLARLKDNAKDSLSQDICDCNCVEQHPEDIEFHSCDVTAPTNSNSPKRKKDLNFKKCAQAYGVSSKLRDMSVYHPPRRRIGTGILNKPCGHCSSNISKKGSRLNAGEDITATCHLFANEISSVIEEQREELLYLRFIQDITQDILSNDSYSNEGVLEMFKKHLYSNREKLDRARMLKEIENLGIKIGLPHFNYSLLWGLSRLPVGSLIEENVQECYEFYEDYHPKVKSSASHSFKINRTNDYLVNVNSSISEKELGLLKQGELFEKKKKESKVLGFLEEMGFDSNIAEEICVCMSDKDFSKFQFTANETESTNYQDGCDSTRQVDDYCYKKEKHQLKNVTELFHYCETDFTFGNEGETQANNIFDQEEAKEMEKILESIHSNDVTEDLMEKIKALPSPGQKKLENEGTLTFETKLNEMSKQDQNCKINTSEQNSKVNPDISTSVVPSPMGSDYSSMKDHDDSIYEGYSDDEHDEGQESGSEVAEEIPEDFSQSSESSGISQITEKLKEFSVDMNSVLRTRSNETKSVVSGNNSHALRELVL